MTFTANQIAVLIKGKIEGDPASSAASFGRIEEAEEGQLAFLANPKYEEYLYKTNASVVIISDKLELKQPVSATLIRVPDPYSAFASLLHYYQELQTQQLHGVQEPSFISATAKKGENVFVGAFAYIGDGCEIGNNVKIFPGVYIGNNVKIADNCLFHPGVKIYHDCIIGKNVTIHAGTVIGGDGFGFARNAS
jgi:UDP-3-O-[3-hydroxymyristoyl] glucosamine N-acyltransferase